MELLERAALRAAIDAGRIVVPLITPRPLGPLHDIARQTGGSLAAALAVGSREAVLSATLDELERTTW